MRHHNKHAHATCVLILPSFLRVLILIILAFLEQHRTDM